MGKHRSRRQRHLLYLLAAVILVAAAAGVYLFFSRLERAADPVPEGAGTALSRENLPGPGTEEEESAVPVLFYDGRQYVYNDKLRTLLILGIDDPELVEETEHLYNTSQSDFLLLAIFDPDSESCTLLQLDRNTMCDVPNLDSFGQFMNYRFEQLALAHTYGNGLEPSCENTVHAVSRLLYGVSIDNYFSLTMDAIPVLNELVGGVTVTVEDDFSGVDDTLIKGETVTLTEENVEHFVRARMNMVDDDSNQARMRRQRTYMTGLFSAMASAAKKDPAFILDAYGALEKSMVTDCTIDELNTYVDQFDGYALSGIVTPEGENRMGERYVEFYVDEAALQKLVLDLFYTPVD